jgi:hypothetical protein
MSAFTGNEACKLLRAKVLCVIVPKENMAEAMAINSRQGEEASERSSAICPYG